MSNPWYRLYNEFATDPMIQSLSFEDQRHFVVLMCLKNDGVIDRKITKANKERIICKGLGLTPEEAEAVKKTLIEFDLIDEKWQIKTWNKRQFKSDHSTERSRKSRKNKETCNGSATETQQHCNAPDTDTDTDKKNNKKNLNFSSWPNTPSDDFLKAWLDIRKRKRLVYPTQRVINRMGDELHKACKAGYSFEQCLNQIEYKSWGTFEASWMSNANVIPFANPKTGEYVPVPFPSAI